MKNSIIFTSVLFAVALLFFGLSFQYRYEARIAPMLVSIIAMLCLAIILLKDVLSIVKSRNQQAAFKVQDHSKSESDQTATGVNDYLKLASWVIGLILGIYLVGLVIAIPIFVLVYLKVHREKWFISISISVAMFLLVWGFFDVLLHVSLFRGILLE